jgi:N-acetylmuramoyl-L-alanine amidase
VTDRSRTTDARDGRSRTRICTAAAIAAVALAGCASAAGSPANPARPATAPASSAAPTSASPDRATSRSPAPVASRPARRTRRQVLAGKIVGIDPGHNGLNYTDPAFLDRKIWNGRAWENCNTTGTQTAGGYTEALFNFNVAAFLGADLRTDGARVVLTRRSNNGIGPCVNRRIQIINRVRAAVAVDIHADSGPSWGRWFTVLEPVADGINNGVIAPSVRFGSYVRSALLAVTPIRLSNYSGLDGLVFRNNLAGLNLATVPIVLIECGNMASPADARLLTSSGVQRRIARALEAAIIRFLTGRWPPGVAGRRSPAGG